MGKTKQVQKIILEELGDSRKGKSDLKKVVKAKDPSLKKHVKKALRKLVKKGVVEKDGDDFWIMSVQIEESSSSHSHQVVNQQREAEAVPIGARLRKEQEEAPQKKAVSFADEEVDLDEEIRRLEAELNQSSAGSSDDESETTADEGENPSVLSLSAFANDRVERLSNTYLPEPGRYKSHGPAVKKKTRNEKDSPLSSKTQEKVDGLKEAVKEVLSGYKARSSERLPFYCRFCSKQYNNETDFFEHKSSDFHIVAVNMERKATYCRLCQKQLTSPDQMKEHLKSKPHHERLQTMRSRQTSDVNGVKGKGNRDGARQWK